ncbi:MAG: PilZ domain-containing protein [Pseudobacteriovorax sp.]|nr:PilZ domain-containing protein [Pseudobacteriovorax sp.]
MKKPKPEWFSEDNNENRGERRRALYVGERVVCSILHEGENYHFEVVDISPQGLALVATRSKQALPFKKLDQVTLDFHKKSPSWQVPGKIANMGTTTTQGQKRIRLGIQFDLHSWTTYGQFSDALGSELITCKSYIRPQISAKDPFFFKEIILFQCNGFTAEGIDLVASSRWKSILPGQIIELEIFIPGKDVFKITCKNSKNFYQSPWKDRFRIFLEYVSIPKMYSQAICEYLVMMHPSITPDSLRKLGFAPGNFDHACYLQKTTYSAKMFPPSEFRPSLLAKPVGDVPKLNDIIKISRELSCKLGANQVAYFNLVFFNPEVDIDNLHAFQLNLPSEIVKKQHILITNLIVSKKALLSDFLIPMLQQIIRISAQAKAKNLLCEVDNGLVKIFKKIGFQIVNTAKKDLPFKIMYLEINSVLNNQHLIIDNPTWNKIYKDINEFLGRNPPNSSKNVMTYKFPPKS